jgi:hypothetical protein
MGWAISEVPKKHPQLSQPARHLLILLADHFNDNEGAAWPSHERLAHIMGVDRRSVIRWMKELKAANVMDYRRRKNNSSLYVLLCDTESLPEAKYVTQSHLGSDTQSPVDVTQSHTNSYRTLKELSADQCKICIGGFVEFEDEAGYLRAKRCPNGCPQKPMTQAEPIRSPNAKA